MKITLHLHCCLLCALMLAATPCAWAQSTDGSPWKATLAKDAKGYNLIAGTGFDLKRPNLLSATEDKELQVTCQGEDCKKITAFVESDTEAGAVKETPLSAVKDYPTKTEARFVISGVEVNKLLGQKGTIRFRVDGNPIDGGQARADISIAGARLAGPEKPNTGQSTSTILGCLDAYNYPGPLYNEVANEAVFILSSTGNVIARPTDPIDENDKITVRIVGPKDVLEKITVQRKSAFRQIGSFSILGQDANTSKFTPESAHTSNCGEIVVQLADFAPGRGEVQLSQLDAKGKSTPFGEFDFAVNPLYRGAFSFGPVYSWLTDRSFGTVLQNGKNVITISEQSPRVHYVISYTHYIWGRLDEEKANHRPFYQQLYPTFGLSVQNTLRNVFAGVTYDILGTHIYLTGGAHIGRVTVIDPSSQLGVGSELPVGLTSVPTRNETGVDWFLGLSLDLRAASKLLGLFGSGTAAGITR